MTNRKLDIAFWNYDRTRLLADGTVKIDGVDAAFHSARIVPEIFEAMIRKRAYDVSELGMTYFLRTFENGRSPFLAIPVFPVRSFRHGAVYINKASGIARPEDLAGKRIGELATQQPELVEAVYQGFCAAKDQMAEQYVKGMTFNNMTMMLPWLTKLIDDDRGLLGDDWWPYGIEANRAAIDAVLRYHYEQGLTRRRFSIEDVFVPGLLDT